MLSSKTRISGRAVFLLVIIGIALIATPQFTAEKGGINSRADDGCYCHTPSDATSITITGLPDLFNASTEYNLTITVANDAITGDANQGGFRLIVNQGTLVYDEDKIQNILDTNVDLKNSIFFAFFTRESLLQYFGNVTNNVTSNNIYVINVGYVFCTQVGYTLYLSWHGVSRIE